MKRKIYFLYLFLLTFVFANAQQVNPPPPASPPQPAQLLTNIGVHDPVMFQQVYHWHKMVEPLFFSATVYGMV